MSSNGTQGTQQTATEHQDLHRRIQESLPWYVNQTLEPNEAQVVEAHVGACAACREQLIQIHTLASTVEAQRVGRWTPSPQHFDALMARLDAAEAGSERVKRRVGIGHAVLDWLAQIAEFPRWVTVAQAALSLILVVALWMQSPGPVHYQTYSDPGAVARRAGSDVFLQVADDLEIGELRKLLEDIGATIVSGPSSVGHFRLRLASTDAAKLGAAITRLRAHPKVRLAESVPVSDAR